MACINPNTPEFQEMLSKVGGNPLLAEMELDVKIKPQVEELFNSTPELANAVYEALGFNKSTFKGIFVFFICLFFNKYLQFR